jgi:hypothetical protein
MSDRLQVRADGDIVVVSLQGKTSMMLSIEAVLRAVWTARRQKARGLLFDIRETVTDDYHSRVLKLAAEAPRMGTTGYPIAVVGLADDPRLKFIEDVGVNRGFRVRTFTELEAARQWLMTQAAAAA